MVEILETDIFSKWLAKLRDPLGRVRVQSRILRLRRGNWGDAKPVGEGVIELRIDYGPGYRVYCIQQGVNLVLLLAGGDKSTQDKDIRRAIEIARCLGDVP